jgi:hypothetical protein
LFRLAPALALFCFCMAAAWPIAHSSRRRSKPGAQPALGSSQHRHRQPCWRGCRRGIRAPGGQAEHGAAAQGVQGAGAGTLPKHKHLCYIAHLPCVAFLHAWACTPLPSGFSQ